MTSKSNKEQTSTLSLKTTISDINEYHVSSQENPVDRKVAESEDNVNIQNIFEQINRLQQNDISFSDDQSIEDILSEAEKLVEQSGQVFHRDKGGLPGEGKHVRLKQSPKESSKINGAVKEHSSQMSKSKNKEPSRSHSAKDGEETSTSSSSPSKSHNIYDLKQTLQKSGSFSREGTPRNPDDSKDSKLVGSLREELKDTSERLKSLQLQYDNLVESGKQAKLGNESLSKAKLALEAKIIERDAFMDKMRKELDTLKSFKSQFDANEEKLRQECAKVKEEKSVLTAQANKDKVMIQDLQRQCKEIEGILAKRHPDSVSALIVASKNPPVDLGAKELLEKRISFLENELKQQEVKHQHILSSVQDKVNGMKENYETHISDLEKQVVTLQHIISEAKQNSKESKEISSQTENLNSAPVQTQVVKPSVNKNVKQQTSTTATVVPTNALARSESHLLATIRGLNTTLCQKEKIIMKMTRDMDESRRLLLKLQKERELNLKSHSVEKIVTRRIVTSRPATARVRDSHDNAMKSTRSNKENELRQEAACAALKKDLATIQNDYEKLKKKRIDDLYSLQSTHEKELMNLNIKVLPLQEDMEKLNTTVEVLKTQIKDMEEQMTLVVMERDQYKSKVEILSSRLNSFSDFGSERLSSRRGGERDYDFLKMKVSELEKRYEGRELRLKTLIDSLAKLKNSQESTPTLHSGRTENVILPGSYLPF